MLTLLLLTLLKTSHSITFREAGESCGILMGSNGNSQHFTQDPQYSQMLSTQYSLIYPEGECLFSSIEPQQNVFNFTLCDVVLSYCNEYNISMAADHLIWGEYNPQWLINGNFTPEEKENILVNHIQTTMEHYGNTVYSWNVVNEAIADLPEIQGRYKENVWYPDIQNYVDLSFITAYNMGFKDVKLFYNDYLTTESTGKSEAVYQMISSMIDRGIPIDGIGFETHISLLQPLIFSDVKHSLQRFSDLGIEVHISEMDVACGIPTYKNNNESIIPCINWDNRKENKQGEYYSTVLKACLEVKNCKIFSSWGFTDKYTWITTQQHPLPWDENYQPKTAVNSILNTLLNCSKV